MGDLIFVNDEFLKLIEKFKLKLENKIDETMCTHAVPFEYVGLFKLYLKTEGFIGTDLEKLTQHMVLLIRCNTAGMGENESLANKWHGRRLRIARELIKERFALWVKTKLPELKIGGWIYVDIKEFQLTFIEDTSTTLLLKECFDSIEQTHSVIYKFVAPSNKFRVFYDQDLILKKMKDDLKSHGI